MRGKTTTYILAIGLAISLSALFMGAGKFHLPNVQQDYEPVQPIAYSHRLHAGDLQIQCLYCHYGAERSRNAGIPSAGVCMNCHAVVTAAMGSVRAEEKLAEKEKRKPGRIVSPELRKIYDALALNADMKRDPDSETRPIEWVRVHNLPDFAYFDHRAHVRAEVDCQTCHGAVETMERVRQEAPLSMGWCVNCHRDVNRTGVKGKPVNAPLDCSACHF